MKEEEFRGPLGSARASGKAAKVGSVGVEHVSGHAYIAPSGHSVDDRMGRLSSSAARSTDETKA